MSENLSPPKRQRRKASSKEDRDCAPPPKVIKSGVGHTKSRLSPDQAHFHTRVEDYQCHADDSVYIASNFSGKEIPRIKKFIKAEMDLKAFCERYHSLYTGPNEFESDYSRRQRLKCRIKYHIKNGTL